MFSIRPSRLAAARFVGRRLRLAVPQATRRLVAMERERPFGVCLVAAVQGLNALVMAYEVLAGERSIPTERYVVLAPAGLAIAAGGLLIAAGLWRLQRWAWTATMIWVGLVMALSLAAYVRGNPSYVVMALSVMQVFYLNQSDVQRSFGPRPRAPA